MASQEPGDPALPPASPPSPPESARAAIPEQRIAALEKEQLEMREKLLALREGDILTLKDKVHDSKVQLWVVTAVAGAIALGMLVFGVKEFADLKTLVNQTYIRKLDDSFK